MKKIIALIAVIVIVLIIPLWGTIFPSFGYIKLDQKLESSHFKQYSAKNLLVFFGYVGCADICTPRLLELAKVYKDLEKKQVDVTVLFINLSPIKDVNAPALFAKSFHPEFKGLYLNQQQLKDVKLEFNVYSTALRENNQLDHSAFLYRLEKNNNNYYLTRIYTQAPFSEAVIVSDLMNE